MESHDSLITKTRPDTLQRSPWEVSVTSDPQDPTRANISISLIPSRIKAQILAETYNKLSEIGLSADSCWIEEWAEAAANTYITAVRDAFLPCNSNLPFGRS